MKTRKKLSLAIEECIELTNKNYELISKIDELTGHIHDIWLDGDKRERKWAKEALGLNTTQMHALSQIRLLEGNI